MPSAHQIIDSIENLGTLPDLYVRLDEAVRSPNSSFDYLGRIISEDASISARLLKITNSAMYNFVSKVDTIQRAMSMIGIRELRELVLATTVIDYFRGLDNDIITMKDFWCHSIACGIAARAIATCRREANVERHYVSGLLHDIGRLIMYAKLPKESQQAINVAKDQNCLLVLAEKEVMGFDHAELGKLLMQKWKLTEAQSTAVAYHHKPQIAGEYKLETAIVHLADIVANSMRLGSSGERLVPPLNEETWLLLNLETEQLQQIVEQVELQYEDAVTVFLRED